MAVRTKEELMQIINQRFADDTSDETLEFLGDISDTLDEGKEAEKWKKKFEDNDAEWRKKYRDRFFNGGTDKDEDEEDFHSQPVKPKTFSDLFTVKE